MYDHTQVSKKLLSEKEFSAKSMATGIVRSISISSDQSDWLNGQHHRNLGIWPCRKLGNGLRLKKIYLYGFK